MQYVKLNNKLQMPQLGMGFWKVPNNLVEPTVSKALKQGYRSIDTAKAYKNEQEIGEALKKNNIPREYLFITTKVWNSDQGYNNTLTAFKESLNKLGLNYLDLYLIHWPAPDFDQYIETYKALEKLYYENKIKAIGVCNFNIEHLKRILKECNVKPVLNQVECHPYFQQKELKKFCERHDIFIEAYSPLMNGQEILNDVVIKKIAKYHNKTSAQVILRWHIQSKSIVIPKSVTPSRIEENINIFDFELNKSEMTKIEALDKNYRINDNPLEMNKK